MRIYLDTSVISGLTADDEPRIKQITHDFFQTLKQKRQTLYISDLVATEILRTKQIEKRNQMIAVIHHHMIELLPTTEEARELAEEYVRSEIIPRKYVADTLHIANAVIHNIPLLVSWNFRHMVRHKTRTGVNQVNRRLGFPEIDICSPEET